MSLNPSQKLVVKKRAVASVYDDIVENRATGRLHRLLEKWVGSLSLEDQLQQISSDESVQREELGFDPVTGVVVPDLDQDYHDRFEAEGDEFEGF